MSLHADVAVPARNRRRLERLCRYVARPPPPARLEALSDGRLAHRIETPRRDGTTHVVMERRELLERLAPAGQEEEDSAPSSSFASESDVGSTGAADGGGEGEALVGRASFDLRAERSELLARRIASADLLKRVFDVDALSGLRRTVATDLPGRSALTPDRSCGAKRPGCQDVLTAR